MSSEVLRICSTCRIEKPLSEFTSDKSSHLGKDYRCKLCNSNRLKKIRQSKKGEKMKLTPEKLEQIVNGLNSVERKIFNYLPINTFWTTTQIFKEAKRLGVNVPITTINGCANELVRVGIAKKDGQDRFGRVSIVTEEKPAKVEKEKEFDLKAITKQVATMRSMADALANQVVKARDVADNLELAMVYMIELEEIAENKSTANDKEFQAFLAFKAAIKG